MRLIDTYTVADKVEFSGVGLHTGKQNTIELLPAKLGEGISVIFPDGSIIPLTQEYVSETSRSTKLQNGSVSISTVEHLLAALHSELIFDCKIITEAEEIPILDGTSKLFIEGIKRVGKTCVGETEVLEIEEEFTFFDEEKGAEYTIKPSEQLHIEAEIDFNNPFFPSQTAQMIHIKEFEGQISNCRTFCFYTELLGLHQAGLIQGGSLDNAIVIMDKKQTNEELQAIAKSLGKPDLQFDNNGVLNNLKLKFENEPARHKVLDILGDITLIGKPIAMTIIASRPGHASNVKLANQIIKHSIHGEVYGNSSVQSK